MEKFVALILISWSVMSVSAMPDYYAELGNSDVRTSLGNEIDETIDPYGGLLLRYVDLKLPGPAGLDITVLRTYQNAQGEVITFCGWGDHLSPRGVNRFKWDIHFGRIWTSQQLSSMSRM